MGLEIVKEEIVRNARDKETVLIAEAKKEADRIMKESEMEIEEFREKSNTEIKRMVDVIKKQELTSAQLESKKMLLEAKKQLIESVFTEVRKKLVSLDGKKREAYTKKLIEKAENDIEVVNVYCNKKDLGLLKDFNAEAVDIIGGLIAENKDKTIRVDYSFDIMLQSIKENELQSINKILFS